MKKQLFLAAAAALALTSVGVAQARDNINWSVSIGDPYIGAVISNEYGHGYRHAYGHGNRHDRGHRYAPRVHVVPPVVYAPPPRVVYQQPYVYAPYGYAPYGYAPHRYAHSGRDRWDHRHGGHRRGQGHYDRDDRRDHRPDDRRDNHRDDRDDRRDDRWQRR